MMCCGEKRGKGFWIKRAILIPIGIAAFLIVGSWVVMLLWNCVLPAVLGVSTITLWQAMGILVLSKILFGGFKHGCGHSKGYHGHYWHHKWMLMSAEEKEKWMHMSPEEKEKLKAEWRDKCCTPKQE